MKTDKRANLEAAASYLSKAVTANEEAVASCRARARGTNDGLFDVVADALDAQTTYLINLQCALTLNESCATD